MPLGAGENRIYGGVMKVYPSRQDLCVCVKRGASAIVSCLQNTYYCTQNLNDNSGYKRPCVGKLE